MPQSMFSGHAPGRSHFRAPSFAIPVVVMLAAIAGCSHGEVRYVEPPPPDVTVATPKRETVTDYVEVTGVAQPVLSVDIRARVKGFLVERHFEEGSQVRAGQLLLVIDQEPFRVKFEQAKARLAEAEAALTKSRQSREREVARAQLALDESQLRLAQDDERRIRGLVASRAVTEQDLERATAELQKNMAQVNATKASLEQTDADYETNIHTAEALVAAARTAVRDAEIELSYCRIVSPIDGRISRVYHDVGNLVGDGESSLLANVVQTQPIYAYASLSLENFLKYRQAAENGTASPGAVAARPVALGGGGALPVASQVPIELGVSNEPGYPHRGKIDYHDPQVDPGTSTIQVRGVFPNAEGAILPGMFVRMRIPYQQRVDALLVPERALSIDQVGNYVLVVGSDDVVQHRPVQVGAAIEGFRVVSGQISADDRVITEGLLRARPGMKVSPKAEAAPAAAPGSVAVNQPTAAAAEKN